MLNKAFAVTLLHRREKCQIGSIECTKQLEVAVNQPPNWAFDQIDYLFPDDEAALNELGVKTDKVLVVKSIEEVESKKKLQKHKIN